MEAGLAFFAACCCRRPIFSWPREGVMGDISAFALAIDLEIMPGDSPLKEYISVNTPCR